MTDPIDDLADDVRAADTVVALTGAGVSTSSGLPEFRGDDGLWSRFDPGDFHIRRFKKEPTEFWAKLLELREAALSGGPEPNDAHRALASLEEGGYIDTVVTQNVDGLHQEAGSEDVVEIHGSLRGDVCRSSVGPNLSRRARIVSSTAVRRSHLCAPTAGAC